MICATTFVSQRPSCLCGLAVSPGQTVALAVSPSDAGGPVCLSLSLHSQLFPVNKTRLHKSAQHNVMPAHSVILTCMFSCGTDSVLGRAPYLIELCLLDEEGLSVLPQLHVQIHWLPVDLDVHLVRRNRLN